jgi:hypothetical protein
MSALVAPSATTPAVAPRGRRRRGLRALSSPPRRMARLPFLVVLIGAFGVGMAGLLMLNTALQNQAFEARTLSRQATELTYVQADLESQLDTVSSPASLAQKASTLGMRANPYPAFLVLPSGKVLGKAKPVKGNELPELVVKTPEQLAAEQAAAQAAQQAAAERNAQEQATAAQAAQAQATADAAQAKADAAAAAAKKKAAESKKKGQGN